jgi:hypothetical protein
MLQKRQQMINDLYPKDITLDVCVPTPCKAPGWPKAKKEEEIPMASYASAQIIADTTEKDQREFARDRIRSVKFAKNLELQKQFGLVDDTAPQTPAEFAQRITDGKYTIDKEKMDKQTYDPSRYIRWRDPSVVEDKEGFKAASEKLEAAYTEAKEAIVLSPIADVKAALDTFKAWSLS